MTQNYSVRTRAGVSILAWVLSFPAVAFYFMWVWQLLKHMLGLPTFIPLMITVKGQLMLACGVLAWFCLLATNIAWLRNQKLPLAIPVAAGVMACIGIWPFRHFISFAVPAILFAAYLLVWTFKAERPQSKPTP